MSFLCHLRGLSVTGTATQAVVPADRCPSCTTIAFKAS
jgi:hypothetical protein